MFWAIAAASTRISGRRQGTPTGVTKANARRRPRTNSCAMRIHCDSVRSAERSLTMGLFTAIRLDAYPSQPFAALPTDTVFSLQVAGALAWAAQLAYEVLTPDKFSQVLRQWQWTNPQTVQAADSPVVGSSRTKGFAATWSDCTIIA